MSVPYYHDEASGITIWHGDARALLQKMPTASVDFIFTDPPYGHNNNNGDLIHNREKALGLVRRGIAEAGDSRPIANDGPEANDLVRWFFAQSKRLLARGGCCCCCGGGGGPDPQFARWSLWLDELLGFKHAVVWDKGGLGMGWHYRRNYELVLVGEKPGGPCKWNGGLTTSNVLRIGGIKPAASDHPTPKPVALPRHFIRLHSDAGDTVLDPFMGSGTTLVAAKQLGRRAIGIEIEERYAEMAAKRLAQEVMRFEPVPEPKPEQASMFEEAS